MFRYTIGCLLVVLVLSHGLPIDKFKQENLEDPLENLEEMRQREAEIELPAAEGKFCVCI